MRRKIAFAATASTGRRNAPNGVRILAGQAIEKGFDVRIFEGSFYNDENAMITDVQQYNPDVLAVSCFTDTMAKTARLLKAVDCGEKIAGGPYASFKPSELLEYCDVVFLGESEESFNQYLNPDHDLHAIPGIVFREGGMTITTPQGDFYENIDKCSFRGWEPLKKNFGRLRISPYWHLKDNVTNIMASRGCINNCSFCLSSKLSGRNMRYRSVENVGAEIDYVNALRLEASLPRLESIVFDDSDLFARDEGSLKELFSMLHGKGLTYGAFASVNKSGDALLEYAAANGLRSLLFGIETNEKNRKRIGRDKNFTDDKARHMLSVCDENGIFTSTCYVIGFPWESLDDIYRTIECMIALPGDYPGISTLDVHPGTTMWTHQIKRLGEVSYLGMETLSSMSMMPSPHPNIARRDLKSLELDAYTRAYNAQRREKVLRKAKNALDTQRATEMFKIREQFIRDNSTP